MDKVNALFNKYLEKYPLHRTEVIIDKMLDDGVITFEDAKKLREGKSIFSIGNFFSIGVNNDLTMTQIMGGHFTIKSTPETNFNRKIEPTNQPWTQGDCWLLSEINALNETHWGKKAIEEAIIPDTDGRGGVTIKFKGSPLKQKEIYITAEEIVNARESGNYTKEDDDVLALELATEKVFRQMVEQGLAERANTDEQIESMGGKYRSFIFAGVKTDKYEQYPLAELLGLENRNFDFSYINERITAGEEKERIFEYASKNTNMTMTCSFSYIFGGWGDENTKDYVHGGHAYAIKEVKVGKHVVLSDPHYSDYEIKMPWDEFSNMVRIVNFLYEDNSSKETFEKILPNNLDDYINRCREYYYNQEIERNKKFNEAFQKAKELNLSPEDFTKFAEEYVGEFKPFE